MASLQCARAVAALLVVYFHSVLQIMRFSPQDPFDLPATSIFPLFGQSGVDVFFVLSGTLIWRSTQGRPVDIKTFYAKRLTRIAPLYWVLTLAAAGFAVVFPELLHSTRFGLAHVVASLAFVPWPNPAADFNSEVLITPVIVPGWTLNFEMFFYALFGLALLAPLERRLQVALCIFALAACGVWALSGWDPRIAFYHPSLIAEFVIGIILGRLVERGVGLPVRVAWPVLIAALIALVVLDESFRTADRFLVSGLPAWVMLLSLTSLERKGAWPRLGPLVRIGDATFSLYLTHTFVLAGLRMLCGTLGISVESTDMQILFLMVALIASCAVGLLTYSFAERAIGAMIRSLSPPRPHQIVESGLPSRGR